MVIWTVVIVLVMGFLFCLPINATYVNPHSSTDAGGGKVVEVVGGRQVYSYRSYKDVQIFHFTVPHHVSVSHYNFTANDTSACDPRNITIFLQAHSYPVINPDGAEFPPGLWVQRSVMYEVHLRSDLRPALLSVPNPVAGDWFMVAFINEASNRITQAGLFPSCHSWLSAEATHIQEGDITTVVPEIHVSQDIQLSQRLTAPRYYRFYVPSATWVVEVNISGCVVENSNSSTGSGVSNASCPVDVAFRTQALPDKDSPDTVLYDCSVEGSGSECVAQLVPEEEAWHYLQINPQGSPVSLSVAVKFFSCEESSSSSYHHLSRVSVDHLCREERSIQPHTLPLGEPRHSPQDGFGIGEGRSAGEEEGNVELDEDDWRFEALEKKGKKSRLEEKRELEREDEGNIGRAEGKNSIEEGRNVMIGEITPGEEGRSAIEEWENFLAQAEKETTLVDEGAAEEKRNYTEKARRLPELRNETEMMGNETEEVRNGTMAAQEEGATDIRPLPTFEPREVLREKCWPRHNLVKKTFGGNFVFEFDLPPDENGSVPLLLNLTNASPTLLTFSIHPIIDIGGTLSVELAVSPFMNLTAHNYTVFGCLTVGKREEPDPIGGGCTRGHIINVNTSSLATAATAVLVPFPEPGPWYLTLRPYCYLTNSSETIECMSNVTSILFSVTSASCLGGKCGRYGSCYQYISGGFIFSTCVCDAGYRGWGCTDSSEATPSWELLLATLLLTLSNLFFLPAVILALKRRYFAEALVYAFTMVFSTFYHACDQEVYNFCLMRLSVMQFCDFYSAIFSFWVTLIAMADLPHSLYSLLHVAGALIVALGVEYDRTGLWVFVVPSVSAFLVMTSSWIWHCKQERGCYPSKRYWLTCLLPGVLLAATGLICYALLETHDNYYYIHSAWHATMALAILCLMPPRREKQEIIQPNPDPEVTAYSLTEMHDSYVHDPYMHETSLTSATSTANSNTSTTSSSVTPSARSTIPTNLPTTTPTIPTNLPTTTPTNPTINTSTTTTPTNPTNSTTNTTTTTMGVGNSLAQNLPDLY